MTDDRLCKHFDQESGKCSYPESEGFYHCGGVLMNCVIEVYQIDENPSTTAEPCKKCGESPGVNYGYCIDCSGRRGFS